MTKKKKEGIKHCSTWKWKKRRNKIKPFVGPSIQQQMNNKNAAKEAYIFIFISASSI